MGQEIITVVKPKPHVAQKTVLENAKRFNALRMGRRWGKTKLAVRLAMETIILGGSVGYFAPTFDFSEEFWEEIKERLEPITAYKSESKHLIRTISGGSIKIWSLEKERAGRGRKYHRVIIDEAAFVKNLKESWEKAIRATLTDYKGDAWFLSTPNGYANYFYVLCSNGDKFSNWKQFHMPTSTNPYLSAEEIEEIRNQLDDLTFAQEFLAEFVNFSGRPFIYTFKKEVHVTKLKEPLVSLPLCLSFDFNVDPITCTVSQQNEAKTWKRYHKEFRLQNSDIYQLCDVIIATYGLDKYFFRVTGDASGNNRSAMVADNSNFYIIIQQKLDLKSSQFFLPSVNPPIKNSRILVNSVFARHPDIKIDESCTFLIEDCQYVEVNDLGEIDKTKDKHRTHLLDCLRYDLNTFNADFIKKALR